MDAVPVDRKEDTARIARLCHRDYGLLPLQQVVPVLERSQRVRRRFLLALTDIANAEDRIHQRLAQAGAVRRVVQREEGGIETEVRAAQKERPKASQDVMRMCRRAIVRQRGSHHPEHLRDRADASSDVHVNCTPSSARVDHDDD
eukprot:2258220-Prymnesium_polylepis.3